MSRLQPYLRPAITAALLVWVLCSSDVWAFMRGALVALLLWLTYRHYAGRAGFSLRAFRPRLRGADRDY